MQKIIIGLDPIFSNSKPYIETITSQTRITLKDLLETLIEESNKKTLIELERSIPDLSSLIVFLHEPDFYNEESISLLVEEFLEAVLDELGKLLYMKNLKSKHFDSIVSKALIVRVS